MVPTCKNVAPYSPTSLNVGTMVMLHRVTTFTCFCPFYAIPASLQFYRKFSLFLVSVLFIVGS